MANPTPEAVARQIAGEWEAQLTIPVSEAALVDLERRIYLALTEQAREIEQLRDSEQAARAMSASLCRDNTVKDEQVRATKRQIERLDKEKEQLWAAVQQWQEDALGKSHEIAALRAALAPLLDIPDDDDEALVALRDRSRAAAQATQGGA
jgi:uncharacterized protein (UPF0335 family)